MPGIRFALVNFDLFVDIALVINLPDLTGVATCKITDQEGLAAINIKELAFDLRLGIDSSGSAPAFASRVENLVIDLGDATAAAVGDVVYVRCRLRQQAAPRPRSRPVTVALSSRSPSSSRAQIPR